jgi:saccharopine dehydrogenase-like NADP-dependent oxidoreductase
LIDSLLLRESSRKKSILSCIGVLVKGKKNGEPKETFTYNVCDHAACYKEVESQAISYTAGVPPIAAAILLAQGVWNPKTMVNVEELDPDPLIALLNKIGLPTVVEVKQPALA